MGLPYRCSGMLLTEDTHVVFIALSERLADSGDEARPSWPPVRRLAPYASAPQELRGVSRNFDGPILSLPSSTHPSRCDRARLIDAVLSASP